MRLLRASDLVLGDFEAGFERFRAAIERDDFAAAHLKKLHVQRYYRARLGDAARLIVQFAKVGDERVCLALELLPTHDYARSRFLKGAAVDETKLEAVTASPGEVEAAPMRYLHPTRTTFEVLDKPLSFDDAQEEITRRRPPLVLVGSAGSGKSALMLHLLRQQPGRVAYVTESAWLAQSARSLYVAFDWDPGEQEADFLSFQQLLESVRVPAGRPARFRDFAGFFQRHRQKVRFTDSHRCFEELRGVLTSSPDGPLTLEAYLALGVRQTIFPVEQRADVHGLLAPWLEHLSANGLYEPNLQAVAWAELATPRYDFVAVDEVQDLTPAQLGLVLRLLKRGAHFLVAGDANQVVHPNFFSWAQLKTMFWRGGGFDDERQVAVLGVSYRNSEAVTRVANRVLRLKHHRFGSIDRESNGLMQPLQGRAGFVRLAASGSKVVADLDAQTRRSTNAAVVVLRDEDKEDARRCYQTPLVFSVHEAKGLEYETIILHRVVSGERALFRELAEGVPREALEGDSLEFRRARDKGDRSLEAYKFFVNALYVGLTRAVGEVWLVEDDLAHPLLELLDVHAGDAPVAVRQSTTQDWQREAQRLEAQGKLEQAEAIRSTILRVAPVPWPVQDEARLRETMARALDSGGVSRKAREQLFAYAALARDRVLIDRLATEANHGPAMEPGRPMAEALARAVAPYEAKKPREVFEHVDRHGVDFRTPENRTPLMMAALAGNTELVEALLARGASREARDHLGMSAVHHALRRGLREPEWAVTKLGPVYDLVAPVSFDLQADGKLVQLGREHGEYFFFLSLVATFDLGYSVHGRLEGFSTAGLFHAVRPEQLPHVVLRTNRQKRTYANHVMARSEADSTYPASRRLWVRERQGHYVPNPGVSVRVTPAGGGTDTWLPLPELMNLRFTESKLPAKASFGRLAT
jgi:hypothetical protein